MDRTAAVAALACALAPGNLERLPKLVAKLIPEPLPSEVAYEIVLQSYLFFGYPQTIEAMKAFLTELRRLGVEFTYPTAEPSTPDFFLQRGEKRCRELYHPNFDRLIQNLTRISPELAEWMLLEGYGKVLTRPGPTPVEREIASIVFLSCSGHPVQLYSHVRGARNLGATSSEILKAIAAAQMQPHQSEAAKLTIGKVFSA